MVIIRFLLTLLSGNTSRVREILVDKERDKFVLARAWKLFPIRIRYHDSGGLYVFRGWNTFVAVRWIHEDLAVPGTASWRVSELSLSPLTSAFARSLPLLFYWFFSSSKVRSPIFTGRTRCTSYWLCKLIITISWISWETSGQDPKLWNWLAVSGAVSLENVVYA